MSVSTEPPAWHCRLAPTGFGPADYAADCQWVIMQVPSAGLRRPSPGPARRPARVHGWAGPAAPGSRGLSLALATRPRLGRRPALSELRPLKAR